MSKKSLLLVLLIAAIPLMGLSADMISQPAATVNLIRNSVITVEALNEKVSAYQAEARSAGVAISEVKPLEVLDIMINDELVLQGAERDGFAITETQIDQLVRQQKASVEQQVGKALTDEQFEAIIKNNYGLSLAQFRKSLKESALVDLYVRGKMSSVIQNYDEPTEQQILDFYRTNRASFMNPELVRLSHIFIPFTAENKAQIKTEMDKIARWLRYNTYTFEELVPKYSQDADSVLRGGDIGWLAFDDTNMRSYLGPAFFDAVFALQLGKPSNVLESTGGYHIVKVTTHTDPKLLTIDDPINPDSKVTVKQYIKQTLTSRNQQEAYLKAIDTLVAQMRKTALVTILYKPEQSN